VKIVLDTNVLIAALIARGTCHELLEHCVVRHTLFTSEFILEEIQRTLIKKFGYAPDLALEAVNLLRSSMTVLSPLKLSRPVCRDPDDDNILATAIIGNCDCIITGDNDLLVLKEYEGINIFGPKDFLIHERTD